MRDHAIVSPQFWIGETGRRLREAGADAQRLALYLISCPNSNMIGLYYLPLPTLCHELGISKEGASKALRRVCATGFASYDAPSETVFVTEMARFQIGEPLSPTDKRVKGVARQVAEMRKSPLCRDFAERYRVSFCLPDDLLDEAPSKPLRSQDQDQDQDQGQDQGQDQESPGKNEKPQPPKVRASETGAEHAARKLVDLYAEMVKRTKHGDTSRTQAVTNAAKLVRDEGLTYAALEQAVRNYAEAVTTLERDYEFRKNAGNFFGRERVFEQYLAGSYEKPVKSRGGGGIPAAPDGGFREGERVEA